MSVEKYCIVIVDGDINISHNEFEYATVSCLKGLQCCFKSGSARYNELLSRLDSVAKEFLSINELVKGRV